MTRALLFSQMMPPAGEREPFEQWYDDDHIDRRMSLSGFRGARRYWQVDAEPGAEHHLAVYDLDSLDALSTPGYRELKANPGNETEDFLSRVTGFTRYTTELISDQGQPGAHGEYLSVVAFALPSHDEEALESWYTTEHVPALLEAEDWLRVHRYRVRDGEGPRWTHLALHELASSAVMDSPERARARRGPKRDSLSSRPWFADSGRWLYRRVAERTAR